MKKVLFATTALIATASVAAADVRISGYGRFGLDYNSANSTDNGGNGVAETNITSRLRIQFDMSAETDGGVAFDARVRMQSENRDGNPASSATFTDSNGDTVQADNGFNGARFGVSYSGLRVNVGNIIGAVENAPGLYTTGTRSAGTGIDGMGFHSVAVKGASWDAYTSDGQGSNGVEALYSAGGFTGHISYTQRNGSYAGPGATNFNGGEKRTGLMATYSFGDYYVTGAYQAASNTSDAAAGSIAGSTFTNDGLYFLAVGGDFGAFGAKLAYGSTDAADTVLLEGNMDIGAASNILVWVNSTSVDSAIKNVANPTNRYVRGVQALDGTAFGINYQYDLGGGSTLVAGYVNEADNDSQFQAGVYFNF